jgi:hypothetical protein
MANEDDEGVEPIPTENLLGGLQGDDDGVVIIGTEWEQRSLDPLDPHELGEKKE